MTAERKDELYDSMIGWICEHTDGGKELFHVLCEEFGMSQEELHDHCIESLDEFFPEEDIRIQFARKVQGCFEEYQASWKKLQPEELIEQAGEIHAIQQLAEELPRSASEEDMAYLLRFKNPLEVASVAWYNSVGYSIANDELDHTLWELRDRRDAEADFEMEPEFYGGTVPDFSM